MKSQPVFQPVLVKEEGGDGMFMSSVRSPVLGVTGHADHEASLQRKAYLGACSGLRVIRGGAVQGKPADW